MIELDTPLASIQGIGPRFVLKLTRLNIHTVRDLLWHFPFRYEDFSQIYKINDLEPGQQATVQGIVETVDLRRSWRRGMVIVEAVIADDTGSIRAIWFNQPYVKTALRIGRLANFSGKVTFSQDDLYLSHPTYELISERDAEETRHTGRLVPIYPETRGLTSKGLRFLVQPLLKSISRIPEWMPQDVLEENNFPEISDALHNIHFPAALEDAMAAKRRFSFENIFLLQIWNLEQKLKLAGEQAPRIRTDIEEMKRILAELPFELTFSQKKSLWEIIRDLEKGRPMNRLLQGDVGSGKTVVAALAAITAARNGFQTAFMAPTEVLAHQHFETLKKLFCRVASTHQPTIALFTSATAKIFYESDIETSAKKTDLARMLKNGKIKIVIGTHALIQKSVAFHKLGLVIVDEQHRFGVNQRAKLANSKSKIANRDDTRPAIRDMQKMVPHFLSMSATPIPRTLMLSVFGDLDISTITELPAGRKSIVTKIVAPANRTKAYAFIRQHIARGRQAFVICPRIEKEVIDPLAEHEDLKKLELKSVKEEYEKLSKTVFPDLRVTMLHGQMPARSGRGLAEGGKSKSQIMKDFSEGKIDILISTSVIEVGVDVPNATIMMIEGADRFGLAQLYQFRGRVGRGAHQSFCFLFTDSNAKTTAARLKAIIEAKNGFELAEKDLAIRGPGEFLGQKQTGIPDIAMAGLQDIELIRSSRAAAVKIVQSDPLLKKHQALREKLAEFEKRLHAE